jgi:hypothetical protein
MSRIDELKKQHPLYAMSAIDIFKMISPNQSNKYIEMLIKSDKNRKFTITNEPDTYRSQIIECMVGWGIDYNYLETFDLETLHMFFLTLNNLMGDTGNIRLFTKFASLNERKLIENNDVTSYSSWDEIEQAVSLAEMKLIDKALEKQIKKVYEDDTWLSLRPLSLEASMKYGANTKWCTTTESGQYYARYSARGILIYNINKKTGYKVACFKNIDSNFDNEFSWWDVADKKIEVLDSEAPAVVLEAIRNEIKNNSVTNKELMTKAEADKLEMYKDGNYRTGTYEEGPSIGHGYITGGFALSGTSTNTIYNPQTFTTYTSNPTITTTGGVLTTSSNTGITNTQMQVHGDLEVNGNVRVNGTVQQYNHFEYQPTEEQRRLFPELTDDDRAREAQQRLEDKMASQLAAANERVAERQLSLLENIELGTIDQQMVERMQMLAGIKTTQQQIQELEADIKRLKSQDNQEAEQPVVHLSLWNKIKNIWKKLNNAFTNRLGKLTGVPPMSVSARLEAVKQSQEL